MRTDENRTRTSAENTAETVRARIESSGERVWRLADFDGMPSPAVAQTLSRLSRQGAIQRLGKGLYYRPRQTAFGPSRPNVASIRSLAADRKGVFPAGIAAANLLGFTTQNPARIELATDGRPSSALRRQGGDRSHAAAGGVADAFRDGCRSSRLPSQPGGVERAVSRGDGREAARVLPRTRTLRAPAEGWPVRTPACPRHARSHRPADRSTRKRPRATCGRV